MTALCSSCTTDLPAPADCIYTYCGPTPDTSCPSDSPNYVTSLSTARGVCPDGKTFGFCCENPLPYANCQWKGTPPMCNDAVCDIGQITVFSDPLGNGIQPCAGGARRTYCCNPPVDLPVPFSDIFPSGVPDSGNDLFHVDFDPDVGGRGSESGTQSQFTETENEDTGAFGEVFIDSPKAGSVSSLELQSDWVLTDCDPKSDQPQQVNAHLCLKSRSRYYKDTNTYDQIPAYCLKADSAACQHVFIDGAENTIVALPKSCGLGP